MKLSTRTLTAASARHPWRTIAAWIATFAIAIAAIVALLGDSLTTEGAPTNNPESERAIDTIARAFPPDPERLATDVVVIRSAQYTVEEPEFRGFVGQLLNESDAPALAEGRSYLTEPSTAAVSDDRHATLVSIAILDDGDTAGVIEELEAANEDAAFEVSIAGDRALDHDFNLLSQEDLEKGELQFGLPAALIILLLVFGAVVAGLIPLLMAIISIVVALGLTAILAQQFELSIFVVNMLTGMGLALGIDYSLFVVSRYREERAKGLEKSDAIAASGGTANRAVVVQRDGLRRGDVRDAPRAELDHALARRRGDPRRHRVRRRGDDAAARAPRPARRPRERAAHPVLRPPLARAGEPGGALLGCRHPARPAPSGAELRPLDGVPAAPRRAGARHEGGDERRDHASGSLPLEAGLRGARAGLLGRQHRSGRDRRHGRLGERASRRSGRSSLPTSASARARCASRPTARPPCSRSPFRAIPSSDETVAAVRDLREDVMPGVFAGSSAEVLVAGTSSENIDYFDSVVDPAPYVIAFVLLLTFVLLTVVFRSVVVAGTAVLLNLLSVGAAYGLLVGVFQYGWGADLLGFQQTDSIEAWVPLFLFSVLFGLSMDYQVFLLSRIRERYDETRDTTDAVTFGVASTARIITGAALIIVAVFAGFARGDLIMFQQMGFGVAVALLLDATMIRSVVLPSLMKMLGEWNWYLPRWLDWLPRLEVEGRSPGTRQVAQN